MKKLSISLITFFCLTSCGPEVFQKKISDGYFLKKVDVYEMQFIGKSRDSIFNSALFDIVIPDYVYAIGINERIITAKRHPTLRANSKRVDTTITEYYIIDLMDTINNIYGPLERTEFESKVMDLNGKLIGFDITYPETKK